MQRLKLNHVSKRGYWTHNHKLLKIEVDDTLVSKHQVISIGIYISLSRMISAHLIKCWDDNNNHEIMFMYSMIADG